MNIESVSAIKRIMRDDKTGLIGFTITYSNHQIANHFKKFSVENEEMISLQITQEHQRLVGVIQMKEEEQ
jgi:hypothetical protein